MSFKLYLRVQPRSVGSDDEAHLAGDYVVTLCATTPESCRASAAFDAILKHFPVEHAENYNVITRDGSGKIVLDTELPAYGALPQYGLNVERLAGRT